MGTPENIKAMNAAARKWDELWTAIQEMESPEKVYVLARINADLTVVAAVKEVSNDA